MRSNLPARARRLVLTARRPPTRGPRPAVRALTAIAALGPTLLLAGGPSLPLTRPARPAAADPSAPTSQPPGPHAAARYRIVGCRSGGRSAYRHGPARREVAIGFDDGPWADTPAFLSMLERNRARATFFMIGDQVSTAYRATLLRELRDGDVLGDHTFTHPYLTRTGAVYAQLHETIGAIHSLTGYTPCVFRPPYGAYDDAVLRTARSLGLATVMWNVDPADYSQPGTGAIERRALAQVQPGSILVSHDGGGSRAQTLAAYPAIIRALRSRGYRIVTIPELLGFRPVYVPCIRLCDGIGVPRAALPRDAIVQRAGSPEQGAAAGARRGTERPLEASLRAARGRA